jgi:hypothetical protein
MLPGMPGMPGLFGGLQGMPVQMGQLPMGMMPGYMPNMQLGGVNMKFMGVMNNPALTPAQQSKAPSLFT